LTCQPAIIKTLEKTTMATVTIKTGTVKNKTIKNVTLKLIQGYKVVDGIGFITVDGKKLTGRTAARVKVGKNDFVVNGGPRGRKPKNVSNSVAISDEIELISEPESTETDAEILTRINKRFTILNKMTLGARNGDIRALFVVGAPGVGKTYGVEKTLTDAGLVEVFSGETKKFEIISGAMSAPGLYCKLYDFRDENNVLVIDDCDDVFNDELSLNLLKAALDTSKKRMIHWNVDSVVLRKNDVPNSFEFKGSVIFISNINFNKVRSARMRNHLIALQSRAFYLDLTIHSEREKMLRIEDLVNNKGMLDQFKLTKDENKKIMSFIRENAEKFNELSLRTIIKIAAVVKCMSDDEELTWQDVVSMTMTGNNMASSY
jgi:replicative DNA helicase